MTLERSDSGLRNLHLFHEVDVIVYVEGGGGVREGEAKLPSEVLEQSHDLQFWQSVFSVFIPDRRFYFKPRGSKSSLLKLLDQVEAGDISNVLIALDRDHDEYTGTLRENRFSIVTFGYSWENDVWRDDVLLEEFFVVCPACRSSEAVISKELKECLDAFYQRVLRGVKLDVLMWREGASFFPRGQPERMIQLVGKHQKPGIKDAQMRKLLNALRAKNRKKIRLTGTETITASRNCYGHLVGAFCYRLLCYLNRRYGNLPSLPKAVANSIAISEFSRWVGKTGHDVGAHYKSGFERIATGL